MKKRWMIVMLAVAVAAGIWIVNKTRAHEDPFNEPYPFYPVLYVNGTKVEDDHVYIVERDIFFASFPLLKTLENLHVPVEWEDSNTARFVIRDQAYILSLTDETICKEGSAENCIVPGKGLVVMHCRVYEDSQDIYLDNFCTVTMLENMGLSVCVDWDAAENRLDVREGSGGNLSYAVDEEGKPVYWKPQDGR